MLERFTAVATLTAVAVAAGTTMVHAHGSDQRGETSRQTVIVSRTFTIAKGQCSQLPADVEVQGLGLERTTTVAEEVDGRLTYSRLSTITGTATDNFGGKYSFEYHNRLRNAPIPGSGIDVDTFKLTGKGAANGVATFFRARVTLDSGANPIGFEILEQSGDPFHCDPL
jgi:hypothetical protein